MTRPQNAKNYTRISPLSLLYALNALLVFYAIYLYIQDHTIFNIALIGLSLSLLFLNAFVSRFTIRLQNRLIRQEENFRHFVLTGKLLDPALTIEQIIALRFASDEEFPSLCKEAAQMNLSPQVIRLRIQHWKADYLRMVR